MKKYWILKGFKMFFMMVFFVAFFGFITMELWNWLIPEIFGLTSITMWQAVGLVVLSKILFGGFFGNGMGRHKWKGHWKHKMRERFEQMTPEEKVKYKNKFAHYCGPWKSEAPISPDTSSE